MFYIPQAHYIPTNPNASVDTASHLAQLDESDRRLLEQEELEKEGTNND